MSLCQAGLLAPVPQVGRYLFFSIADALTLCESLQRLTTLIDGTAVVAGLGPELIKALGADVPGLHSMQPIDGPGVRVPSTPQALCCWLRGTDAGDLLYLTRRIEKAARPGLRLDQSIEAFRHQEGRDLTGYEDGTENPVGDAAQDAALVQAGGAGLTSSSFMAVQQWVHDLDAFEAMATRDQDNMVGRRRSDNEELPDAPASAHVKRTAQENFEPPAFVLRRSMPWAQGQQAGLMFVAFGKSFDAFEAQMRRMAGLDDGVTDAMFKISRPVTGAFFWCPPLRDGRLDLMWLGL
jgi:putative iron-dependent peroxidase